MKRTLKKTVATALSVSIIMTATVPAFAETVNTSNNVLSVVLSEGASVPNYSETVTIDGTNYTYHYSYDEKRNETITITNDTDDRVSVVYSNRETGEIFLNNEIVAVVTREGVVTNDVGIAAIGQWELISSGSAPITSNTTKTVDEVAAVIAAAISLAVDLYDVSPFASLVTEIILKIGRERLKAYIGYREGLMAYCQFYQLVNADGTSQYKLYWSLCDEYNNTKEGPYTSYFMGPIYARSIDVTT